MWQLIAQAQPQGVQNTIDTLARTPISLIVYIAGIATLLRLVLFSYTKAVPTHQRGTGWNIARIANEALDAIVYALVFVFLLIRPFGIQAFTIPTGSMVPTLKINDYIVANKAVYRYSEPVVGDIVVFKPPARGLPDYQKGQDVDYIKRLQGVGGDVVEIKDYVLYRNGKAIAEPYVHYTRQTGNSSEFVDIPKTDAPRWDFKLVKHKGEYWPVLYNENSLNDFGTVPPEYVAADPNEQEQLRAAQPAAIPPGFFLMIGDNRNNSFDGRFWGLVERKSIIGRAEFIWFPFSRWGSVR
ncbi:MAG: signal peptidase I [Fimbriimonadaceae bacterium]